MELTTEAQNVAKSLRQAMRKKHKLVESINRDRRIFIRLVGLAVLIALGFLVFAPISATKTISTIMAIGLFMVALMGNAFNGQKRPRVPKWEADVDTVIKNGWEHGDFIKDSVYWAYPRSKTEYSRFGIGGRRMLDSTDPDFLKEAIELIGELDGRCNISATGNWFRLECSYLQNKQPITIFAFRGEILTPFHLRQISVPTETVFFVETRTENIKVIQKSGFKQNLIASEQLEYIWSGAWNPLKDPNINFRHLCPSIYWFRPYRVSSDIEAKKPNDSFIREVLLNWVFWCPVITIAGFFFRDWYETNQEQPLATILLIAYVAPATITGMFIGGLLWMAIKELCKHFAYQPLYKFLHDLKTNKTNRADTPDSSHECWYREYKIERWAEKWAKRILLIVPILVFVAVFVYDVYLR